MDFHSLLLVRSLCDLPPENWTVLGWNFPLMILGSGQGQFHEGIEVHGGADRVRPQAGGGRFTG